MCAVDMGLRMNCKRVIVSGLLVYMFMIVYLLVAFVPRDRNKGMVDVDDQNRREVEIGHHGNEHGVVVETYLKTAGSSHRGPSIQQLHRTSEGHTTARADNTVGPRSASPSRHVDSSTLKYYLKPSEVNMNFTTIGDTVFAFSAFFDDRYNDSYIRLIVVAPTERLKTWSGMYCIFHTGESAQLQYYETCEPHLMSHAFYVMSCRVPHQAVHRFRSVSALAISPYHDAPPGSYSIISVVNNRRYSSENRGKRAGHFAVCVPPLFGDVNVVRLVEFIELSRLLGSVHFTIYTHNTTRDVLLVLEHYRSLGVVTVLPWNIPVAEDVWYKGQSTAIADCLLRNMYINTLVTFNDLDEFIVPRTARDWQSMVEYIHQHRGSREGNIEDIAVYRFKSAFFETPNNIEEQQKDKHHAITDRFVSLSRTVRTKVLSSFRTKMMVYPDRVFELGIHHLSKQAHEEQFCLNVKPEIALLHHYRKCDSMWGMSCNEFMEDKTLLRFQNKLINNTIGIFKQIKYSGS